MKFSLEKIAKNDLPERSALAFTLAPTRFKALARLQDYNVENVKDARALAQKVQNGEIQDFNFNKLFSAIPISTASLKEAGKQGIVIL